MNIDIPELSLVLLMGASGSGKSTFAKKHFKPTEILSSDYFRGLIADDETAQWASKDAFETLHFVAAKRMQGRRFTVIDATNVQSEARKPFLELARRYHYLTTVIVLDLPESECKSRNKERPDRNFGSHVIHTQHQQLRRSLKQLNREGFRVVHELKSVEEIDNVEITLRPLWTDKRSEHGPFDIISDVHGCYSELRALLARLGHRRDAETGWSHPEGRRIIFVGDLVDRGPSVPEVLRLAMEMIDSGHGFCVVGNHEQKLLRKMKQNKGTVSEAVATSLRQLEPEPEEFKKSVIRFMDRLLSHFVMDDGKLVIAHAGLKEELQGRASGKVRAFAMFGDTTGEKDEYGMPVRLNWAADYRGKAMVVYGHTPVVEPQWLNNTINIDTGCVFGGKLTALRYPEKELVSVPAEKEYAVPGRPLHVEQSSAMQQEHDALNIDDVLGKKALHTRLHGTVMMREENSRAALEVMSRFAVDPRWLIYLPPTMSPSETSKLPHTLEHPLEAFKYFQKLNVDKVICQEKHMGSRAVIVLCKDEATAESRFGTDGIGTCYTRTGRPFFTDPTMEHNFLTHVQQALTKAKFWDRHQTPWVCLDCELMPWSAKAQELLKNQYAAVGSAAEAALTEVVGTLQHSFTEEINDLQSRFSEKLKHAKQFRDAYRAYCWSVESLSDLKLAPFHIMATEAAVHLDKDHTWHMEQITQFCQDDDILMSTQNRIIDLSSEAEMEQGIAWWEELTGNGGEGMVVKPLQFWPEPQGRKMVQPALKCRGREYLRIIYGPDYDSPEHLERLRNRGLSHKRSLALREFALGIEALERFIRKEPLRRVHECVFAVLAMESEPVDPRL